MSDLYLKLTIPIDDVGGYKCESNVKPEKQKIILGDFLALQYGRGVDESPLIKRDVYNILIEVDLGFDTFSVKSDTGNKGLRDGLLLEVLRLWRDEK